jgi:hypothetical protein
MTDIEEVAETSVEPTWTDFFELVHACEGLERAEQTECTRPVLDLDE